MAEREKMLEVDHIRVEFGKKRHPFVQVIQQLNTNVIFSERSRDMYKNCKHGGPLCGRWGAKFCKWGAFYQNMSPLPKSL